MKLKTVLSTALLIIFSFALVGCNTISSDTYTLTMQIGGQGKITPGVGAQEYAPDTIVAITATPAEGWLFSHWQGEVAEPHSLETTTVADKSKAIKAVFQEDTELIINEAPGGIITQRVDGSYVTRRPKGNSDIEYIMVHAMSDAVANPTDPFRLERIRKIFDDYSVEAHYVIDREGDIHQFVEDSLVARHAGIGTWNNDPRLRNNMNRYAVGIELLGIGTEREMAGVIGTQSNQLVKDSDRGYTADQYDSLQDLITHLIDQYNIDAQNILGHENYDPGRKWDPGELFDWTQLGQN